LLFYPWRREHMKRNRRTTAATRPRRPRSPWTRLFREIDRVRAVLHRPAFSETRRLFETAADLVEKG
jgi:hypothetical protein